MWLFLKCDLRGSGEAEARVTRNEVTPPTRDPDAERYLVPPPHLLPVMSAIDDPVPPTAPASASTARKPPHLSHRDMHSKRPLAQQRLRSIDSPAYDASEEDNDPLTDDGASAVSIHINHRPSPASKDRVVHNKNASNSREKAAAGAGASLGRQHQLATSVVSDDDRASGYRVDSPTYDGDVESSTTAGKSGSNHSGTTDTQPDRRPGHQSMSSASTLNTPALTSASLPADTEMEPGADTDLVPTTETPFAGGSVAREKTSDEEQISELIASTKEPSVPLISKEKFNPAALTPEDIQSFVAKAISGEDGSGRKYKINPPPEGRPARVYADGSSRTYHFFNVNKLTSLQESTIYFTLGRPAEAERSLQPLIFMNPQTCSPTSTSQAFISFSIPSCWCQLGRASTGE
jgi:choline-phosphate cytidylyltransferase